MAGHLLNAGQVYFLELAFKNQAPGDLFLGLHTKADFGANLPADLALQLGDVGFTEVTGTDYARQTLTRDIDWTLSGHIVTGPQKTFTVGTGGWLDVNGYFVAQSAVEGALDAIWAESFPVEQAGNKLGGDAIKVTPKFEMKDDSEA